MTRFPYKTILIACSVNTARSRMAEGFLRDYLSKHGYEAEVYSGGIASNARDGMLISLDARLVMEEEGIMLSDTATSVDLKKKEHRHLVREASLILTLTGKHKEEIKRLEEAVNKEVYTFKEFAGEQGDIDDPSMKGIEGFRRARDEIKQYLYKGLKRIERTALIDPD